MDIIRIGIMDNGADFSSLVSHESTVGDRIVELYSWSEFKKELSVGIYNKCRELVSTEKISLALGVEVFVKRLEEYGFELEFFKTTTFSQNSIISAWRLKEAGFLNLIVIDSEWYIDGLFKQNFLTTDEQVELTKLGEVNFSLADVR